MFFNLQCWQAFTCCGDSWWTNHVSMYAINSRLNKLSLPTPFGTDAFVCGQTRSQCDIVCVLAYFGGFAWIAEICEILAYLLLPIATSRVAIYVLPQKTDQAFLANWPVPGTPPVYSSRLPIILFIRMIYIYDIRYSEVLLFIGLFHVFGISFLFVYMVCIVMLNVPIPVRSYGIFMMFVYLSSYS